MLKKSKKNYHNDGASYNIVYLFILFYFIFIFILFYFLYNFLYIGVVTIVEEMILSN